MAGRPHLKVGGIYIPPKGGNIFHPGSGTSGEAGKLPAHHHSVVGTNQTWPDLQEDFIVDQVILGWLVKFISGLMAIPVQSVLSK